MTGLSDRFFASLALLLATWIVSISSKGKREIFYESFQDLKGLHNIGKIENKHVHVLPMSYIV